MAEPREDGGMIKLVLPKSRVLIGLNDQVFFLGGPIHGGGDWQRAAIRRLTQKASDAYVVCPCRYQPNDPLCSLLAREESENDWMKGGMPSFHSQTLWERHYLSLAGLRHRGRGCVVFWLPEEDAGNPRSAQEGPYARDTRGELGEWRVYMAHYRARVAIGAEPRFPGLSVIEKNYRAMVGETFIIHETLEATIDSAVAIANQ